MVFNGTLVYSEKFVLLHYVAGRARAALGVTLLCKERPVKQRTKPAHVRSSTITVALAPARAAGNNRAVEEAPGSPGKNNGVNRPLLKR